MKALTAISLSSLFLFLLVLTLPLASAVPPVTQVQAFTEGYVIEGTPQEFIKQNTAFQYNFFVYNISTGKAVTNDTTECFFYLAIDNGTVIAFENATYFTEDRHWGVVINENNFSSVGHHPFGVKCNSTIYGGAKVSYFTVTPSGSGGSANYSFVIIVLSFVILLIGIFSRNIPTTILGGMAVTLVGLYSLINGIDVYRNTTTEWVSIILMSFGGFWMVKAGLEYLDIW